MIALYVKTHRVTGLKYLGKTKNDPFTYRGSGLDWATHLLEHGEEVDTEVIRWCRDKESLRYWGIYFSELWDVVNSKDWANRTREEGQGGAMPAEINGMSGKRWWNNGTEQQVAFDSPGPDWKLGRLTKPCAGLKWWNNGVDEQMADVSPGPAWRRGKLSAMGQWWTNGVDEVKATDAPGPDWTLGRKKSSSIKGYRFWNKDGIITRSKESPGPGWDLGTTVRSTAGMLWWNDGTNRKLSTSCPGPGWTAGKLLRRL